jgi:hypothetical protein
MTRNPKPRHIRPNPNFRGAEGFILIEANLTQRAPNTGARNIINMGLIDCNQLAGISHPLARLSKSHHPKTDKNITTTADIYLRDTIKSSLL